MHRLFVIILAAICAGCASTHNLNEGPNALGGGVQTAQVKPGLYSIYARTNWAPWSNYSGARSVWTKTAESLCGKVGYQEIGISEADYDTGKPGPLPYIVTQRDGHALCDNAATSMEEALVYLGAKPK